MTGCKKRQIVLACDAFLRPNELISYWKKGLGQKKSVRLVKTCLFFFLKLVVAMFFFFARV